MNIPHAWVPLLMSAMRDAVRYNDQLLQSETLRNREDYEEHMLQLSQFFEYLKDEYQQGQYPIPLAKLVD